LVLSRFYRFVDSLVQKITPVDWSSVDVSFDEWLAKTDYPQWRKDAFRRLFEEDPQPDDPDVKEVKAFIKDETYDDYKAARWIMSRSDAFKTLYGPWIHEAERVIYKSKFFVKFLDPQGRIDKMCEELWLTCQRYATTDYTSFESHFLPMLMAHVEMKMLERIFQNYPQFCVLHKLNQVVMGRNDLASRFLSLHVFARMSGEMLTSLGNGFTNVAIYLFLCAERGIEDPMGIFEGDDGLYPDIGATVQDYKAVGFTTKVELSDDIGLAGFCHLQFDPYIRQAFTDPYKVILSLGWTARKYLSSGETTHWALLRAKAMSYMCLYPQCPIVSSLLKRLLDITADVSNYRTLKVLPFIVSYQLQNIHDSRGGLGWIMRRALELRKESKMIHFQTRNQFQAAYGFTYSEQRECEEYLSQVTGPFELPRPMMERCPHVYLDYWDRYVVTGGLIVDPFVTYDEKQCAKALCRRVNGTYMPWPRAFAGNSQGGLCAPGLPPASRQDLIGPDARTVGDDHATCQMEEGPVDPKPAFASRKIKDTGNVRTSAWG